MKNNTVIFTDLDGTLLNHEDYTFDEALEMLDFIKEQKIPLIFTTSKTKKECEILQEKIGLDAPFIVENGACIFGLEGGDIQLGLHYPEIRLFMDTVKEAFAINAFSDMSVEAVMEHTDFSYDLAKMAKMRDFSEPFLIHDERKLTALEKLAEEQGMKILKGGRFYHCVGINQDKGKAVSRVLELFSDSHSIGLGDNYNDVDMLRVVDTPILLPHHKGKYIDVQIDNLIKAPHKGSLGWNETLKKILKDV
ncbi:MAG TPA: HAD-IIB family hydrolase [Campylobacterales bacterium]|nr:HAD-IIB family hydrolase [Campylobacterales bacterium]